MWGVSTMNTRTPVLGSRSLVNRFRSFVALAAVLLTLASLAPSPAHAQTGFPSECTSSPGGAGTYHCRELNPNNWVYTIYPPFIPPQFPFRSEAAAIQKAASLLSNYGSICSATMTSVDHDTIPPEATSGGTVYRHEGVVHYQIVSHRDGVPPCAETAEVTASLLQLRAPGCNFEGEGSGDWYWATDSSTGKEYCRIPWDVPHKTPPPATKPPPAICKGNPCEVDSGKKVQTDVLYTASGTFPLELTINYDSRFALTNNAQLPLSGRQSRNPLGIGWFSKYFQSLRVTANAGALIEVHARRANNQYVFFRQSGSNFVPEADVSEKLTRQVDGFGNTTGWQYKTLADDLESYDADGKLLSIKSRGGIIHTLGYGADAEYPTSVSDPFGNTLTFGYDTTNINHVATITLPGGTQIALAYDSNENLTTVTFPDTNVRTYHYEDTGPEALNLLTGITDEANNRFATWAYTDGNVTSSQHAGGVDNYNFTYNLDDTRTIVDPLGQSRTYDTQVVWGARRTKGGNLVCQGCGEPDSVSYDANGNASSLTDYNGNQTTYGYDLARNLETTRTEAFGTTLARTITTTWNTSYRLPLVITEPNRKTTYTHDTAGNILTMKLTDTSVMPNVDRIWTYTYNTKGQVLTIDGPRTDVTDVTTYTYYNCSTGYQCGQVQTITNALSQVTTFNTYNAHGQPLTITDPNGVVTTLTYDARQRVTSRDVGGETTTIDYWPTGLLKKVTLPDGGYVLYTYDNAQRLYKIEDAAFNRIQYTLDNMGNRTADNVYDPTSFLSRTHTRAFNALNQLWKEINAAGTAAVTTVFGYDSDGNQTTINAPMSRNSTQVYDALSRLKQVTDPGTGVTKFGYDSNDNLASVTDPRNLVTTYTNNGFGEVKTQVSPDSGTTTNTFDSGGNLKTSTDARSAISTFTYDALNRPLTVGYKIGSTTDQTITFTYDSGTNGTGRLTGASDANHSLAWTYDAQGRVTGKGQTVGTVTKSVGYGYTSGRLTSLTLPSGQVVTYGYNSNHQAVSVTVGSTTVLTNATYDPFGPLTGWSWGNGSAMTRVYDTDGKVSQFNSAGLKTYGYDNAFRITGITDTVTGANSYTYGYDSRDRLTSASKTGTTYGWTYDANGNRLTQTGTSATTFTISSTSNRISSSTGALARTYSYDSAGNTTGYTFATPAYNNRGRMKTLTKSGVTATYVYDALGHLIKQSGGTPGTVLYMYDEAGHLVGEYTSTGALVQETVWLGDIPVATLRPNGASVLIYYVHTDHLNTPIRVTRPSDNKLMWTWYASPFGTDAPNENPASGGTFKYNLRFAGQLYDSHAGLHQNGFRDYDPSAGRFMENDPIGLGGGINPYSYVGGHPTLGTDPSGLFQLHTNTVTEKVDNLPSDSDLWPRTVGWILGGIHLGQTVPRLKTLCDCQKKCSGGWALTSCTSSLYIHIYLRNDLRQDVENWVRSREQEHVADFMAGADRIRQVGSAAEKRMLSQQFGTEAECIKASKAAVGGAVSGVVADLFGKTWLLRDRSGSHTHHGPWPWR